ncbi:hypothetical protein ACTJIJ_22815 [Niabella sp. 22666]|uniref:hypothetical protein n=1 Tax=Niabella sp. 22666 TaxID=3453954 RepID=UPI003F838CB2
MAKRIENTERRSAKNRVFTTIAAELAGVSVSMAEKVVRGDKVNEKVLTAYILLEDRFNDSVREVSRILPEIDPSPAPNDAFCARNDH